MTRDEAEDYLAGLPPEELRPVLSRLANFTPDSVYYSEDFGTTMAGIPGKVTTDGTNMGPLAQGLLMVACTAEQVLGEGGEVKATFTAAKNGTGIIGDWEVIARRIG